MTGATHVAVAWAAAAYLYPATDPVSQAKVLAVTAVGALLPDIDMPGSTLGSKVPGQTGIGRAAVGGLLLYAGTILINNNLRLLGLVVAATALLHHRGITHSLLAIGAAWFASKTVLPALWQPFVLGFASHIAADILTPMGVPILWPLPWRLSLPVVKTSHMLERSIRCAAIAFMGWRVWLVLS